MPIKKILNLPEKDEIIRPKVYRRDWERMVALIKRSGNKFKVQGFLGELVNNYEETHCPECWKPLDSLMCKSCGKGGTL